MKKKNKLWLLVAIAVIMVSLIFGIIDFSKAKNGEPPLFAFEGLPTETTDLQGNSTYYATNYIGVLYYLSEDVSISPTQPFSSSPSVKMGIWFFPGIEVYSNE